MADKPEEGGGARAGWAAWAAWGWTCSSVGSADLRIPKGAREGPPSSFRPVGSTAHRAPRPGDGRSSSGPRRSLIAVDTILFTMVVPALPEFADRYGFSDAVASLIFAAFPVGQLVTALLAAGLVDRVGRRPVMILAALVLAAATLAFALANGVAPARLRAAGAGARRGAGVDRRPRGDLGRLPPDELGFRMGLAETAGGAIGLVGPPVGGRHDRRLRPRRHLLHRHGDPAGARADPGARWCPRPGAAPATVTRLLPDLRRLWSVSTARVAGIGRWPRPRPCWRSSSRSCRSTSPTAWSCRRSGSGSSSPSGSSPTSRWSPSPGGGRTGADAAPRSSSGGALMAVGLPFIAVGPAWSVAIAFAVVGAGMAAMVAPSGPADGGGGGRGGHGRPLRSELGRADRGLRPRATSSGPCSAPRASAACRSSRPR